MGNSFFIVLSLMFFCACKTLPQNKAEHTMSAASKPGTCNIEGKIVAIMEPTDTDMGSICSKYPCRAKVQIIKVFGCGSAVSIPIHGDDISEMQFVYTLHSTEIFPGMKTHFPGLKIGDIFLATVTQHMIMGSAGSFIIYDYEVK